MGVWGLAPNLRLFGYAARRFLFLVSRAEQGAFVRMQKRVIHRFPVRAFVCFSFFVLFCYFMSFLKKPFKNMNLLKYYAVLAILTITDMG